MNIRELEQNGRASSNTNADTGAIECARKASDSARDDSTGLERAELFAQDCEHFREQSKSSRGQNFSRGCPSGPRGSARRGNAPAPWGDFSACRARASGY
jgi:hypothetical protein